MNEFKKSLEVKTDKKTDDKKEDLNKDRAKIIEELLRKYNDYQVCYINRRDSHIYFFKKSKELDLAGKSQHNKILPLAQLKAINEKVKELGWYEAM